MTRDLFFSRKIVLAAYIKTYALLIEVFVICNELERRD